MSALGQKQTIEAPPSDVRFTPKSRHRETLLGCPLSAISGHESLCDLLRNHNRSDHIRVEPAVILNRTGRLEDDAGLGIRPYHYIPGSVSGSRGVGHDILVHPFNCITDMGGDLRRRIGDLRHLYLDYGGARAAQGKHEQQRGHACRRYGSAHRQQLFQSSGNLLGMLLVALEDFQPGGEQVFELGIAGRRYQCVL